MSGQSKKHSVLEAGVNICIGFSINWTANMLILPHFGFTSETGMIAFEIGLCFTAISLVRQYVIRRWFNNMMVRVRKWQN